MIPALWEKPASVTIAGDSQCTVAALEKSGGLLAPYFANRVSEIALNLAEISKDVKVSPVYHLPGPLNPADIPTRESASAADLEPASVWFSGPSFLHMDLEDMPLSREFLCQGFDLPPEEVRPRKVLLLATKVVPVNNQFEKIVLQVLDKFWSLQKVLGVIAWVLKASVTKDVSRIRDPLTPDDLALANRVIFFYSMGPTKAALDRGDLSSLRVHKSRGIYCTRGRVGRALEKLLGIVELPVLMPGTRLAKLIMWESHCEDHRRSHSDALARSRERAWIVRGTALAKFVTRHCVKCKIDHKKQSQQLMSDIPEHQLLPCPPFTNISLDFLGPFKVRGLGNQRARIKVYGLVIVCQNVRAVKLLAVPGYDTHSFLLAYR
jgi:hypothetical protein